MDKEKIFPSSKKIHVAASSSLVDLKAELFKRKAEALAQQNKSTKSQEFPQRFDNFSKKPKWQVMANQLEAKGELNKIKPVRRFHSSKAESALDREHEIYEEQLKKSKASLEAKAKLYEQRYSQAYYNSSDSDSDTDGATLINFKQKVLLNKDEAKCQDKDSKRAPSPVSTVPLSEDLDEDEDWVEFTDSLGRSRRCLRRDFEHFKKLDEDARKNSCKGQHSDCSEDDDEGNGKERSNVMSEEKRKELERKNWEEIRPVGPVRYRGVIQDEVREHGVGFYMMSTDDEERKKQLDMLNSLRQQTAKQREMREKIKEKRAHAMKERLAKVAERKGIQLKVDSTDEQNGEKEGEEDDSAEEEKEDGPIGPYPSLGHHSVAMTSRDREALTMKEIVTREWDAGKRDEAGRVVKSPSSSELLPKYHPFLGTTSSKDVTPEVRNEEFAPPASYSTEGKKGQFYCYQSTLTRKNASPSSTSSGAHSQAHSEKVNNTDEVNRLISEKLAQFRNQT